MTSHGSTTAASEAGAKPAELDTIEAEIDTIKADVQLMRAEADNKQKLGEPRTTKRQQDPPARARGRKILAPTTSRLPTPKPSDLSKTDSDTKMAASQGKELASPSLTSRSLARISTSRAKASPAAMVSPTSATSTESFQSHLSRASTQGSGTTAKYYDAVESPQAEYYDAVEYPTASQHMDQSSPHFAQPTQAATRRMDETLRRDTSPAKSGPETPPGKSTKAKAPNFETDKRALQRGQKRTSLPEGWMLNQEQSSPVEQSVSKKEQLTPGSAASLKSADQSPAGPNLRKKTSSYMSPTKSAQHRSIATIGEEKRTRVSPRAHAGHLRVNTNLASKDAPTAVSSPSRHGTGSDEAVVSPKSQLSSAPSSKNRLLSPLKMVASAKTSTSSATDRLSLVIRLPLPLARIANTTMIPRGADEDLLDPIKEKLGKEDLLRRDSIQDAVAPTLHGSRGAILGPVLARIKREPVSSGLSPVHHLRMSEERSRPAGLPISRDPDNEPMSRLISGLRGQSSANIGKALAGGQRGTSDTPFDDPSVAKLSANAAVLNEGRKRSGDPAILYQGRKPSVGDADIFNRGPSNLDVPVHLARSRKVSQPSSLRATAIDFVPNVASDSTTQTEPSLWEPETLGRTWYPQSLSLFHDDTHEDIGTENLVDMSLLPENARRSGYDLWNATDTGSWQEEPVSAPALNVMLNRHVNLIHGDPDLDTPTISPTSNDTSPPWSKQHRQQNLARWEISGKGRRKYHWTGGDGLEISFRGLGPDAEHDPNSPVLYRNYRANTNTLHMEAASYPRTNAPGSPLPPHAPKLMRDYAEKMAFSQIPCIDDQWTGNYDVLTTVVPMAGVCGPCREADKRLHRIGGGIDLLSRN